MKTYKMAIRERKIPQVMKTYKRITSERKIPQLMKNIQDDNQGEEHTPGDENIQSQKIRISFFTKDTYDDESSDDNIPLSRLKVVDK